MERHEIVEYLRKEIEYLVENECYYLIDGVRWAKDRIAGKSISERDYEPGPKIKLPEL